MALLCDVKRMLRRIILGFLLLTMIGSASGYAQTQTTAPKKIKPAKIKKPKAPKAPKALKPARLTPGAKALKKANDKNNKLQRQAFEKQRKQQAKALKKATKQAKK